ncbi:hypothetical protein [Paenibacillus harenae]|uniref:Thymidylate synthase n=1 Tax=Paenibacillus harenae TaxID=306543 RepID=A0ABT9U7D8_PAEHA|nr:hypothetical protein [Paenibacillus harenae]MDQ0114956.1 hypothetical protein [Paenibacillus harenae]
MNTVITGRNVSEAWANSILYLNGCNKREEYNLIAEIVNPIEDDIEFRRKINCILTSLEDQSIETVANTIFPQAIEDKQKSREVFYDRFYKLYPKLRRIQINSHGTYFGRLVAWNNDGGITGFNQLEYLIQKLYRERNNNRGIRVMYEMSIYNPILDNSVQMGFPCMSFISIKVREDFVDLTAVYRSQYFIQKAYGNYLGLGRLLEFISRQSGYRMGKLTCIATHASIRDIDKRNLTALIGLCSNEEQIELEL